MASGRARISIALCTYNGERFLPKQLESIENQTRLPDEVIVCDDRSSDGTIGILEEFAASAPLSVKIIVNRENLGSTKNFEQAIRACTGDLIALSDQDDIWHQTRLECSELELLAHPEATLVFSDGDIIDYQDRPTGTRLWQTFEFTDSQRQQLLLGNHDLCVKSRFATGATMMFRASLRDRCLPVGPGWIHDEWIAATAAVFGDLRPIDAPLIFYRKHASQQKGPNRQLSAWGRTTARWTMFSNEKEARNYWDQLAKDTRVLKTLCNALSVLPLEELGRARLCSYQDYLKFLSFRVNLPRHRLARLYPVLSNYREYSRYVRGWRTVVKDALLSQ